MGYILVLVLGAALVLVLLMAFVGGKRRATGRASGGPVSGGGDVTPKAPEAESATPAASSIAPESRAQNAQKHTPPA